MATQDKAKPTRWEFYKLDERGVKVKTHGKDPEAHIMALVPDVQD